MKNRLLTCVTFLLLFFNGFSQYEQLQDINLQLRSIFSQITYPDNDVLFLYDRSAKMSDSVFYANNCQDTIDNMS